MEPMHQECQIQGPINEIIEALDKCPVTMENLIEVMEVTERLGMVEKYKGLSEELRNRAINFSRCNFASWQVNVHHTMLFEYWIYNPICLISLYLIILSEYWINI